MRTLHTHILIIGAGPAGLAAAAGALASGELLSHSRTTGCQPIVMIDRDTRVGGILNKCIHDGFGLERYRETLTGPEYITREAFHLDDHPEAIHLLTDTFARSIRREDPSSVKTSHDSPYQRPGSFIVDTLSAGTLLRIAADSVILAMGCRERPPGAIALPGTRPAGIFTAGTAQRLINLQNLRIGNRAVIIGSGDFGLIMARRLHLEGIEVAAVIEIRPYPGGLDRNVRQCLIDFGIPLLTSTAVIEVMGEQRVTGVRLAPLVDGQPDLGQTTEMPCDTILLSVGLIPEHDLATDGLAPKLDSHTGGFSVDQHFMTTVHCLFACGNLLFAHDLVDQVSDESEQTGASAAQWMTHCTEHTPVSVLSEEHLPIIAGSGISLVVPQRLTGLIAAGSSITLSYRVTRPLKRGEIRMTLQTGTTRRVLALEIREHLTPAITYQCRFTLPEDIIKPLSTAHVRGSHLEVICA